jgi:hypothetical protein
MKHSLRQRLYPTLPRSPLDGWCARGLMALAVSGGIGCGLWLATDGQQPMWLAIFLPLTLLFGPQFSRLRWFGSILQNYHRTQSQLLIVALVLVFARHGYEPSLAAWSLFFFLAVHGFALRYSRPDNLAAIALLLPLLEVQYAFAVLWPLGWISRSLAAAWLLVTLLLTIGVATWLHARWTRRRLQIDRGHFENGAETGEGLWSRARLMLTLGLVLVPLGLALQQLALFATSQPAEVAARRASIARDAAIHVAAMEENKKREQDKTSSAAGRELERDLLLPSTIPWQGKLVQSDQHTVVFHLISDLDLNPQPGQKPYFSSSRPLYLLTTTYDHLDWSGLSRGPSAEVVHYANDGIGADDWIIFDEQLDPQKVVKYQIRQRLLFNDSEGVKGTRGFLLHDRQLVALRLPSCRLDHDGTALGPLTNGKLLEYQWWSQPVPQDLPLLATESAKPRFLALPQDPEFQDWILEARKLCFDANTREDKLALIVAHFQNNFRYDLEPSTADGIAAFTDFFNRKRGYCSYFASAAMLFLRANGIPCRVASGFVVSEYSTTKEAYVGRLSDAHAWVEVQQHDGSWRTVDTTPSLSRQKQLAALRSRQQGVNLDEPSVKPELLARVDTQENKPEPPPSSLFSFGSSLTVLGMILPLLASALIFSSLWAHLRSKRRRRKGFAAISPEAMLAMNYWARIQWLLNELGFRSKRSQSAAEFTLQVQHFGGEFYRPLSNVAILVYRSRFGGYAWTERQEKYLNQYEEMLEEKLRKEG